jgi:hypothetical protein
MWAASGDGSEWGERGEFGNVHVERNSGWLKSGLLVDIKAWEVVPVAKRSVSGDRQHEKLKNEEVLNSSTALFVACW